MATEMDAERQARRAGRRRVVLAVIVIILFVLLLSLRGIVGLYTDYLWYEDIGREDVWTSILGAQIVLVVVFVALFWAAKPSPARCSRTRRSSPRTTSTRAP